MTNPAINASLSPSQIWLMAIRPKTLPASLSPVVIGTAMAFGDGIHHFPTALKCLGAALFLQIGTNLSNDYFDFKKGADNAQRIGPTRVTQAGLVAPLAVLVAALLFFALAGIISIELIQRGGWPIAVIAVTSILSGILYTAGPKPLGYLGLGDIFVLIFFGPVAVAGTYYVQSYEINTAVILSGLAPGLLSMAILTINNYRDMENDKRSGKKTLAVRFGGDFAQWEYLASVITASLVPVFVYYTIVDHIHILLASTISLLAVPAMHTVLTKTDGPSLNAALALTGKLLLIYSIIFSIGWIL